MVVVKASPSSVPVRARTSNLIVPLEEEPLLWYPGSANANRIMRSIDNRTSTHTKRTESASHYILLNGTISSVCLHSTYT